MYQVRYYNKYGAKKQVYGDRKYHSGLEAQYAQDLDLMLKAKEIKEVIPQFRVSIDINGYHICNYYVDFKVIHNDDSVELVEIKGFETETWRLKAKLLEAVYLPEHPECEYIVLKQGWKSNYKYLKKKKTKGVK